MRRIRTDCLKFGGTLLFAGVAGCAHSAAATPFHVRAGAPRGAAQPAPNQPIIVDFKAGDRIPVVIRVDGDVVETTPSPSTVWLTAKRDFSVRLGDGDFKTSVDGSSFDERPTKPGRFQLALQVTPGRMPTLTVAVITPEHAKR